MTESELFRHNEAIDPHLHIWGWEIPAYLFLGGIAAGVMILAAVLVLRSEEQKLSPWMRLLPFAAPVLISIGMTALLLDLAYKLHVWRFYLTFRPLSPMSWGAWILVGIYPATALFGLALLDDPARAWVKRWPPFNRDLVSRGLDTLQRWATGQTRRLAWANLALGVGLGAYTGMLLGTLAARPAWNSVMLAPLFLASGVSTGAAFMMLFPVGEREHHLLRRWDLIAIGSEAVLLALFLLSLVGGGAAGAEALERVLGGEYTAPFWTLVVLAGLFVPFLLEVLEARRHLKPTVMAPVLVLVGGLSLRVIIVLSGQA